MKNSNKKPKNSKPNNSRRFSWGIIILIIVAIIAIALVAILIRHKLPKSSTPAGVINQTPEPTNGTTQTPLPTTAIPKALLDIEGSKYEIKGVHLTDQTFTNKEQKVNMGEDTKIQLSFDKEPKSYKLTLYRDEEIVYDLETLTIQQENLPADGDYRVVCEVIWDTDEFTGPVNYSFQIGADFPPFVEISATETLPGELIVIKAKYINSIDSVAIETNLDFTPNVFKHNDEHIILLPVSYYNKENRVYNFNLTIDNEEFNYEITLNEKEFVTQQLTIDPKVAAETRNDKSAQEVREKIDPLRPVCDDVAHWDGDFIMPVEGGRVREYDFGKRRHVNGAPTSYRHNGLDIGHDLGVPIMASNSGRVLIADYMIGTGYTVIIEHGFGLKTWYYHMDELNVSTGDVVTKGQLLGTVGSTGFSTGPHLHFSSSINNAYINPITLINEGIPLIENTK